MIEAGVTVAVAVLTFIVWLVRLESKVTAAEVSYLSILARLERIERLLDSLVKFNDTR